MISFQHKFLAALVLLIASDTARATPYLEDCSRIFETRELTSPVSSESQPRSIRKKELIDHVERKLRQVYEFAAIRKIADDMGIRVWLFGGTAASFLHYAKWDLASQRGLLQLQRNRFDYEFSHIFRSSQDIDLVVDARPEVASQFQNLITEKFPHFLGNKISKWEVRTLRHPIGSPGTPGYKEALLNDEDFEFQTTDSNSIGMIEITHSTQEPIIRDLKNWDEEKSIFLEDALKNRITYFRSSQHFTTARAKRGENPEILSVIRLLVKAFQFDLDYSSYARSRSKKQLREIKEIIDQFDPKKITHPIALQRIQDTAKKLIIHAVNLESAINQLDQLGLRQKLISIGNASKLRDSSWWLNREPLKSFPVGQIPEDQKAQYPTAKELELKIVAHETTDFSAYESITRSHSGEPNVLISRENQPGETAIHGDGFYVREGKIGARGSGFTIRFEVNPEARLGVDFKRTAIKDWYIFTNKKALKIIYESLQLDWDEVVALVESGQEVQLRHSDSGLLEKFKRRLSSTKMNEDLELLWNSKNDDDLEKLIKILSAFQNSNLIKLLSKETLFSVIKNFYQKLAEPSPALSEEEIQRYVRLTGPLAQSLDLYRLLPKNKLITNLSNLLKSSHYHFETRKRIGFEILLNSSSIDHYFGIKQYFNPIEFQDFIAEIQHWNESPDPRKKKFSDQLHRLWNNAIHSAEIETTLKPLINFGFFNIHYKNKSNLSILQVASYYDLRAILDWLIETPEFDFNLRDSFGNTEVEQLRLHNKTDWADEIQRKRPEAQSRGIQLKSRSEGSPTTEYPQGAPIVDFVRFEAGSFLMGGDRNGTLTTLTRPFEILSVDVTQKMYAEIQGLLQKYLQPEYANFKNTHHYYYRGNSYPAYGMSFDQITLWITGLNRLSLLEEEEVQTALKIWLPRHQKGDQYQLPTEAQWEMVTRLGGRAGGNYSHEKNTYLLNDYAVFDDSPIGDTPNLCPVGSRRPVFYYGKPLYDLQGLIWHWVSDWHQDYRTGGLDPQGPDSGTFKVLRGGSFRASAYGVSSESRFFGNPQTLNLFAGFRLVRLTDLEEAGQ